MKDTDGKERRLEVGGGSGGKGEGRPLVSVVVPTFNHEKYVLECIESILSQDYPNIELIVINDGSTDGTDEKLRGYLKEHHGAFTYISKVNEGVGTTMNKGLGMAEGEYFCEVCSDDTLVPGSITKRVAYLEEHSEVEAVFGSIESMDKDGLLVDIPSDGRKAGFDSSVHTFEDFVKARVSFTFHAGMSRTEVLRRVGGFDEDFYTEDTYMRYLLVLFARVASLDEVVVRYRHHETNISKGRPFFMRREKILSFEKLLGITKEEPIRRVLKDQLFREYLKYLKRGLDGDDGGDGPDQVGGIGQVDIQGVLDKARALRPYSLKTIYYRVLFALGNKGKDAGRDALAGKSEGKPEGRP